MTLSPETDSAIDTWLGMSTWYTSDLSDMERWYAFIDRYSQDHGFSIDEKAIRDIIKAKLAAMGDVMNDELEQRLIDRTHLACSILEFLGWRAGER
jgi:hypothetical protein